MKTHLVIVLDLDASAGTAAEARAYGDMFVANFRDQQRREVSSSLFWQPGMLVDVRLVDPDEAS